jgi:hypothetical protein
MRVNDVLFFLSPGVPLLNVPQSFEKNEGLQQNEQSPEIHEY